MKRFILLGLSAIALSLSAATGANAIGQGERPFVMANLPTANAMIDPAVTSPRG